VGPARPPPTPHPPTPKPQSPIPILSSDLILIKIFSNIKNVSKLINNKYNISIYIIIFMKLF